MGARLVTLALSPAWAELSHPARVTLIAMCQTALDKTTPKQAAREYIGGHDRLILLLTGHDPEDDAYRESTAYQSDKRRVQRHIQELAAAGAIELLQSAHRARHARYRVLPHEPLLEFAAAI